MTELPVEILASVFLRVLEPRKVTHQARDANLEPPPDIKSLYAAMLVCRRWRDVTQGSPELWRALPPSITRDSAALFLQRSWPLPICAYTHAKSLCAPDKPLYLESPHFLRLRKLHVIPNAPHWSFSVGPSKVPNLVFLELQHPTSGPSSESAIFEYPVFGGTHPTLQALSLCQRVLLPSDHFPALAHLRLAGPRWFPIHVEQLLRLLSHLPALETLYLTHVAMYGDNEARTAEPVALPRLQALCVEPRISNRAAAAMLSHLILPRQLIYQYHSTQVLSNLRGDHCSLYVPPMDNLTTLELIEDARHLHIRARGPAHGFWLHFCPGTAGRHLLPLVLAQLLPMLRDVTALRVSAATYSFSEFPWPQVFHSCPALAAVVVAKLRRCSDGLASAPGNAPLPNPDGSRFVPWETLDSFALQLDDLDSDSDADLLPLADVLAHRAQLDCRIRNVTISSSRIDGRARTLKHLDALAAHVDLVEVTEDVLWDVADDRLWKVENEWWPLYPRTEADMRDGWGLHGIVG